MGESDFFSFGDEELGAEPESLWGESSTGSPTAGAVLDLPEDDLELVLAQAEDVESAGPIGPAMSEKGVRRPRGDSSSVSSAKRRPSSRRLHGVALLVLAVGAIALARIVLLSAGASSHAGLPVQASPSAIGKAKLETSRSTGREYTQRTLSRRSPAPAVEPHRVKKKKAQTRRRAKRRRSAHGQGRRAGGPPSTSTPSAGASEDAGGAGEAPPYEPSQPEPAPAAEPSESSGGESTLRDGSTSPEFGL